MRLKLTGKKIDSQGKATDSGIGAAPVEGAWQAGALLVAELRPEVEGKTVPLVAGNTWALGTSTGGVLRRLEFYNPTNGAVTVSAAMKISPGTPEVGDAILAWNKSLGAGQSWRWAGELPLYNLLYVRASAAGVGVYYEVERAKVG